MVAFRNGAGPTPHRQEAATITTTVERFFVNDDDSEQVHFEENPDLTVHLLRGGLRDSQYAERGIVLVHLGVDDAHSEVSLTHARSIRASKS